jgi:hypothetical protein
MANILKLQGLRTDTTNGCGVCVSLISSSVDGS